MLKEVLLWVSGVSVVAMGGLLTAAIWSLVDRDIAGRGAATIAVIGACSLLLAGLVSYLR